MYAIWIQKTAGGYSKSFANSYGFPVILAHRIERLVLSVILCYCFCDEQNMNLFSTLPEFITVVCNYVFSQLTEPKSANISKTAKFLEV
jgi:hypothetical protein